MANRRSQIILGHILEIAGSKEGYSVLPAFESLDSLILDAEDVIFCWPSRFGWGEERVTNRSNGLLILTRHRLLLVGVQPDEIEATIQLSDIVEYNAAINIVKVAATVFRTASTKLEEAFHNTASHEWFYLEPADGVKEALVAQMSVLPYSFPIQMLGEDKRLNMLMPLSIQLPISVDMLQWNKITIGYEALIEIAGWLKSGTRGFYATELTQYFGLDEKILFAATAKVKIDPAQNILGQHLRKGVGVRTEQVQKGYALGDPTYLLLTSQHLFMISREVSKMLAIDKIEAMHYSKGFRGESILVTTSDETVKIMLPQADSYRRLFEAMALLDSGSHIQFDLGSLVLSELEVLQPFEEGEAQLRVLPASVNRDSEEDLSRAGYIYILINQEFGPGLLKIGKTTRQSELRATEIFTTGVPGEFMVAYDEYVKDL